MSPEERRFRATDAKQLLENKLFVEAFGAMERRLDMAALTCDPDDATKAQRVVISKQLLAAIKREITRIVEDGNAAEIQMAELDRKQRGIRTLFQR